MVSTSRFDRFEILAPLGAGGMGEVVKARALGPHGFEKVVAIKRIRAEWAEQEVMAERFIREARIAARLQHANIVQVFDFGRHDDELFIVMEFVDGQGLDDILANLHREGKRPTLAQTLQIALDVSRALDAAHTLADDDGEPGGIIHRDVSPANILVSHKGVVKLTDFGIAAWASHEARTSLVAGKPLYMAPEQLRGGALDGRADLFAVGMVLYEMITGERPWKGIVDPSPDASLDAMGYTPPSALVDGLPDELDALMARLLEPNVDDRVGSARELAKELLQISYRSQIVLDPSELAPLIGDRIEQATAPTLPQYASGVQTLVATGVSPDGITMLESADEEAHTTEPTASRPERPERSNRPAASGGAREGGSWWMGAAAVLLGLGTAAVFLFTGPAFDSEAPSAAVTAEAAMDPPRPDEIAEPPAPGRVDPSSREEPADVGRIATETGAREPGEATPPDTQATGAPSVSPAEHAHGTTSSSSAEAVPTDPVLADTEPTDAEPTDAEPTLAEPTAPRHGDRRVQARPPAPRTGDQTATAVTPSATGATGELDVFSRPWAQIFVDGERQRQNAPVRGLRVPAGRHQVRLVNPMLGLSEERTVVVPPDGRAQVRVIFEEEVADPPD